ncbi:MAG: 30S ribosomal protein S3 [Verrucomicrobia bacterium]|nr:30S ribosomal protein S3 [Verrucomicrobiota bacterium]OQW97879.1 MAG: 30S ribosomal protein S3 [Verrucomicrobia bacterium A1]
MGQKVNPIGMRVTVTKDWRSRWYADKKHYGTFALEDDEIRRVVKERLKDAAVPEVLIERHANLARITVLTARPGIVIGRKGQDVEVLRQQLSRKTGKEIYIEIREVRDADRNAQLVAEGIAAQLERRVSFRRAVKRAAQMAMDLGADGIRIHLAGRLGGSELARRESLRQGKVPLHTLRAKIDYGFSEAHTMAGKIGVKVWICHKEDEGAAPSYGRKERAHAPHA